MLEPDNGTVHEAEAVADFLTRNRIVVVSVGGEDSVDTYHFFPADGVDFYEYAVVSYDRDSGDLVAEGGFGNPRVPDFVKGAIETFGRLLSEAKGDFYADTFTPIHNAFSLMDSQTQ